MRARLRTPRSLGTAVFLTVVLFSFGPGCASRPTATVNEVAARAADLPTPRYDLPWHLPLGRVISVDQEYRIVLIQFYPTLNLTVSLDGSPLLVRRDDLTPTAELAGTNHQRQRIHGARWVAGRPEVGQEVVLWRPPDTPPAEAR